MFVQNDTNPYINAYNQNASNTAQLAQTSDSSVNPNDKRLENKLHHEAVSVSISTHNIMNYLNIKSAELTRSNSSAQEILQNILNGKNTEFMDFFSGKTMENGFSLESIGYTGKAISELSTQEAGELISDDGFFGITATSDRVSDFVLGLAGNDLEALKESRKGLVQGFEEAEKLFGGELPEISYKTQERTLSIIDKKIEELLKSDLQKEVDAKATGKEIE